MIDISDGLVIGTDAYLPGIRTKVAGFMRIRSPFISETRRVAGEFDIDPLIAALNGGEDYELLFTVPVSSLIRSATGMKYHIIGHMVDSSRRDEDDHSAGAGDHP